MRGGRDARVGADQRKLELLQEFFVDDAAGKQSNDIDARLGKAALQPRQPAALRTSGRPGTYHRAMANRTVEKRSRKSEEGGRAKSTRSHFRATVEKVSVTKRRVANVRSRARRTASASSAGNGSERRCQYLTLRGLRPTPDRVRETLFNWIEHLDPSARQRPRARFFCRHRRAGFRARVARRSASHVDREQPAAGRSTDRKPSASWPPIRSTLFPVTRSRLPDVGRTASFEIIFIDPPFDSHLLAPALAAAARLIAPGGLIYAESGAAPGRDIIATPIACKLRAQAARDMCTLFAASAFCIIAGQLRIEQESAGDHDGDRGVSGNV